MEVIAVVVLVLVLLFALTMYARVVVERNELMEANKSIPLYREALKRQHEELEALYKKMVDDASVGELADILNGLSDHKDRN